MLVLWFAYTARIHKENTMRQATKSNATQIQRHIDRQRAGKSEEFSQRHPIIDAVAGGAALALLVAGSIFAFRIVVGL
jgi:hypothetical protein